MTEAVDEIITDLYKLYADTTSISVASESATSAIIAHGWYQRVRLTGEAVLSLLGTGHENEAAPLRRSMIEHALALHWLSEATTCAVDALFRAHQERMRKIRDSLTPGWSLTADDFEELLGMEVPQSKEARFLTFKHLCERFESWDLYVAWLTETGFCHPSYTSAIVYADGVDDVETTRLFGRARDPGTDSRAAVAALVLMASEGFNNILAGKPWSEDLDRLRCRLSDAVTRTTSP